MEDAQRNAARKLRSLLTSGFYNIDFVRPARAIQPLEVKRLKYWDEVNELAKQGTLNGAVADGSVPSQRLYVQRDRHLSSQPSDLISMLPLTHNADSFAHHVDRLPEALPAGRRELGMVAHNALTGGRPWRMRLWGIDAALAAGAGMAQFADIGNLDTGRDRCFDPISPS